MIEKFIVTIRGEQPFHRRGNTDLMKTTWNEPFEGTLQDLQIFIQNVNKSSNTKVLGFQRENDILVVIKESGLTTPDNSHDDGHFIVQYVCGGITHRLPKQHVIDWIPEKDRARVSTVLRSYGQTHLLVDKYHFENLKNKP